MTISITIGPKGKEYYDDGRDVEVVNGIWPRKAVFNKVYENVTDKEKIYLDSVWGVSNFEGEYLEEEFSKIFGFEFSHNSSSGFEIVKVTPEIVRHVLSLEPCQGIRADYLELAQYWLRYCLDKFGSETYIQLD